MMENFKTIAVKNIIGLILLLPSVCNAWSPCFPFCASCEAATYLTIGQTTNGLINLQDVRQGTYNDLVDASIDIVNDFQSNIVNTLESEMYDKGVIPSLDGFAGQIRQDIVKNTMANAINTDNLLHTMTETLKAKLATSEMINVQESLGKQGQPASGVISVCKAKAEKNTQGALKKDHHDTVKAFHNYNNSGSMSGNGQEMRQTTKLAIDSVDNPGLFKIDHLLSKETLSEEEVDDLNWTISAITNLNPLQELSIADAKATSATYEFKRRQFNAKATIVQEVLASQVINKSPKMDADWVDKYAGEKTDEMISVNEAFSRQINGRLQTPDWFQEIQNLSQEGLQKELSYLMSIENKLMFNMLGLKDKKNRLISLKLVEKLKGNKPSM